MAKRTDLNLFLFNKTNCKKEMSRGLAYRFSYHTHGELWWVINQKLCLSHAFRPHVCIILGWFYDSSHLLLMAMIYSRSSVLTTSVYEILGCNVIVHLRSGEWFLLCPFEFQLWPLIRRSACDLFGRLGLNRDWLWACWEHKLLWCIYLWKQK